jgi:hypothetical protein
MVLGPRGESLPKAASAERRSQVRYPFRLAISCKVLDLTASDPWLGECRDLSSHGIRIVAERRFEPETVLLIELKSDSALPVRSFVGQVKWTARNPASGWLLGCALIDYMTDEVVEALVQLGKQITAASAAGGANIPLVRRSGNSGLHNRRTIEARIGGEKTGSQKPPTLDLVDQLFARASSKSQDIRLPSRRSARIGAATSIQPSTPTVDRNTPAVDRNTPPLNQQVLNTPPEMPLVTRVESPPPPAPKPPEPAKAKEPVPPAPVVEAAPPKPQGDPLAKELFRQLTAQLDADDFVHARETALALLERNPNDPETLAVVAYLHDQLDAPGKEGELRCFKGHGCTVNCVGFSQDGRSGFSGSGGDYVDGFYTDGDDRTLRSWDLESGRELARFSEHSSPVLGLACTPSGSHVLTASRGGTLCFIDTRDFTIFRQLARHRSIVHGLAISADGRTVLTGCDDGVVRLWDLAGKRLCRFEGHTGPVTCVAYAPDGTWGASGGLDRTVRIWDLASGKELYKFVGHEKGVLSVAIDPGGQQQVVSAGADGTMRLWDAEEGEIAAFRGHEDSVTAVAFAPNGQRVLSGGRDKTVRLWDAVTAVELCRFTGHSESVKSVAVSPGGRRALSGSADTTVRLWGLPS